MRSLFYVLIVSTILTSCSGCVEESDPNSRPVENSDEVVAYGDVVVNDEQLALLEADLNDYLLAAPEGRFEDLINWSHPNFLPTDAQRKLALETMLDLYDRGVRNDLQEWKIDQVFPLQDLDSMWVCLVRFEIHNKMDILDYFKGKPGNFIGPLKQQFPFAEVSYDSTITQYTIKGNDFIYAFFEKRNDNMYFISTAIVQSAKVYSMIDAETLDVLRSYQY